MGQLTLENNGIPGDYTGIRGSHTSFKEDSKGGMGKKRTRGFDYTKYDCNELLATGQIDLLFRCCEALLYEVSNRYLNLGLEYEEYTEIGYVAFMKAVHTYDPNNEKGVKFASYAACILENELKMQGRKLRLKRKHNISFMSLDNNATKDTAQYSGDNKESTSQEIVEDKNAQMGYKKIESNMMIQQICKWVEAKYKERDYKIFCMYLAGKVQKEIASEIGVTQPHVCRVLKSILNGVQKQFYSHLFISRR